MPVISVVLLYLGRRSGAGGTLGPRTASLLAGGLGAAAILGLLVAGLLAATVDWSSQVVDFALAGSFALLGCGAVAAFADRRVAWVRFNWTTLAAAALWPLCSPLPPGTYSRLTIGLQLWVSDSVMRALGISGRRRAPAGQHHRAGARDGGSRRRAAGCAASFPASLRGFCSRRRSFEGPGPGSPSSSCPPPSRSR